MQLLISALAIVFKDRHKKTTFKIIKFVSGLNFSKLTNSDDR
jgi:hypothetical protein